MGENESRYQSQASACQRQSPNPDLNSAAGGKGSNLIAAPSGCGNCCLCPCPALPLILVILKYDQSYYPWKSGMSLPTNKQDSGKGVNKANVVFSH